MMPERSFKPPVWQVKQVPWLGAPVKAGSGIAAFATTVVGLVSSSEKPPSAIASTTAAIVAVCFIQHPRLKAVGGMLPPVAEPPPAGSYTTDAFCLSTAELSTVHFAVKAEAESADNPGDMRCRGGR